MTLSCSVFGQTEERTLAVDVPSRGAEARQEAFQKAVQSISRELAEKRLGAQFLNEQSKRFESEVLAKSEKYILSVKGTGSKVTDTGTQFSVSLSISLNAFDSVLRQSGLMQLRGQSLTALLFLDEQEKAAKEGPWWSLPQLTPLNKTAQGLVLKLSQDLKRRGIEVLDQKKTFAAIPAELKKANFTREELIQLGRQSGASLVLFGLISPKSSSAIIYHAQWVQVPAERILSELQGEAKTVNETSDKFLAPVTEAQAFGTLNSKPITLRIRGDLSPKDLQGLRDDLSSKVREIRSLRERLMGRGEFSFEAESPQSPNSLVSMIQAQSFKDFELKASLDGADQILLSVKRR